jgi:hypothetical protein
MSRFVKPVPKVRQVDASATLSTKGSQEPITPSDDRTDTARVLERISKYVPAEIITGYTCVIPMCSAVEQKEIQFWLAVLVFFCLWIATPVYLIRVQKAKKEDMPQVWIATVSFLGWAYCLGGPFVMGRLEAYYNQKAAMVLVGLGSVLVGLFYQPKAASA